jgi:arsenate reductase
MTRVLFACIHNAGRSQMAAAWFNALADHDQASAISAGTEPGVRVHPEVLAAMREVGIELEGIAPQKLTDELAATASLLVTMGCGEACPVVPGLRRMDWPLEDPKGKTIERVREIREDVRRRVSELLRQNGWTKARIRAASTSDLGDVERLLETASLPTGGLRDQFPAGYVVASDAGMIVGCAGLETHARAALLRSVAVSARYQNAGIGRALVADRIAAVKAARLDSVYLLTTTASKYFSRMGFLPIDRARVPLAIASSVEFAGICPSSAACLVLTPGESDLHELQG